MIILGFGSTEEAERLKIKEAIREEGIEAVCKRWNDLANQNDELPREQAPGRYTRVSYYDDMLHFMHINRNHALSPDGWACWQVEEAFP